VTAVSAVTAVPEPRRWRRTELGQVAGIEMIAFGTLVLLIGTLVIADAWAIVDARLAVAEAAREGARAFVQATAPTAAETAADNAAAAVMTSEGRNPARMTVTVTGQLARCESVSVTVSYPVPLLRLPLIGTAGGSMSVRSRQTELVDPYRSGLPGTASCQP